MNKERVLSKIKKLYELSLRGVDGEKKNAETMMNELMLKYDVSIDEIQDEKRVKRRLYYKSVLHRKLLSQIIFMIVKGYDGTYWKVRGGGSMIVELTELEFIEVSEYYEAYKNELSKEINKAREMAYKAFIHKNKVFSDWDDETEDDETESKSNDMSLKELLQFQAMVDTMEKVDVKKKLSS